MAEVGLQGSRVMALVRQCEPAGVAKHVRVDLERHPGLDPSPLHHPGEPSRGEGTSPLTGEYEG